MKYALLTLLMVCFGSSIAQTVNLHGNLTDLHETQVVMAYQHSGSFAVDTLKVSDGTFNWSKSGLAAGKAMLMLPGNSYVFYIEPGNISISGKIDSIIVTGSEIDAKWRSFGKSFDELRAQKSDINERLKGVTGAQELTLLNTLNHVSKSWSEKENAFIKANPDNVISTTLALQKAAAGDYDDAVFAFNLLSKAVKTSDQGKYITELLAISERSRIGAKIPDFIQNDPEGKPVKFSDFRGNYVFLDFWASWCAPCRAENSNVLKAYTTFEDKNFTIIGISVDHEADQWKKAIKDDNMPWTMVSDLKGKNNEIASYFHLTGVPFTLLIDPEGRIIAKELYGLRLHQKLREVFGNASIPVAQIAKVEINVLNAKDQILKVQLPVDGTWFSQATKEYKLKGDSTINLEVPVQLATWIRINGCYIIVEPGKTNVVLDYAKHDLIPNVDRNMEGIVLFSKRNAEFYQSQAKAYYKKDSTETGLLKLIDQDRVAELKPYKDLLAAKKISQNFYDEMDHYFKVQANIIEATIPMIVFSETKKLSPELDHMWTSAYEKASWDDLQNTFHPDFYYHADYFAFTYLQYYLPLKQGKKLEVKDESTYLKLKYDGLGNAFKGKMREHLMASFLRNEMMQNKFQPVLLELFTNFKSKYPNSAFSRYIQHYVGGIESFLAQKSTEMTDKQKVIPNYASIDSFEQLLDHFKNKNVFIDVWATWCGPCKEEFKYSKETEEFLGSNNVEMLFISTDNDEVDERWKTMIKHYDLTGWHVRTNKKLLQDMLNKFWDGKGYAIPRYILVSNGKVVNSEMPRPSEKEQLYGQVKRLLKK